MERKSWVIQQDLHHVESNLWEIPGLVLPWFCAGKGYRSWILTDA